MSDECLTVKPGAHPDMILKAINHTATVVNNLIDRMDEKALDLFTFKAEVLERLGKLENENRKLGATIDVIGDMVEKDHFPKLRKILERLDKIEGRIDKPATLGGEQQSVCVDKKDLKNIKQWIKAIGAGDPFNWNTANATHWITKILNKYGI